MFENHRKSGQFSIGQKMMENTKIKNSNKIFWVGKNSLKMPQNWPILETFWKPEACSQTVLPDMSPKYTKIGGKSQN